MRAEHLRCALRLALVLLIAYLLEDTLLSRLRPWNAMPLPIPLLAAAAGLGGGGLLGGVFGLAAGIVCDSSLGESGLLFTVLLTVLGFFCGFMGEFILSRSLPSFLILSGATLVICTGMQALLFGMLIPTPLKDLGLTCLKQLILTLPFLLPAYICVRWALRPLRGVRRKSRS
jgi:hypothetical protein